MRGIIIIALLGLGLAVLLSLVRDSEKTAMEQCERIHTSAVCFNELH